MTLTFDISQDELPIFLAEADEHLQTLDEILIQLEQLKDDKEALQAAFRAAHTLKGMAGVIGHNRMVRLTHALETAMDGVRKGEMEISTGLIDLALDAVDGLRLLREELVSGAECSVDLDDLLNRFETADFSLKTAALQVVSDPQPVRVQAAAPVEAAVAVEAAPDPLTADNQTLLTVRAEIEPKSIASAARAFQLMLALQELGTIQTMTPTQAEIETARPVASFFARFQTDQPIETVRQVLGDISEVAQLVVEPTSAEIEANRDSADAESQAKEEIRPNGKVQDPIAPAKAGKKSVVSRSEMVVRTSVERLDALMGLVGELITDRNHLNQIRNQLDHQRHGDNQLDQLTETVAHLGRITDQLQEEVMRIRMLPISNVFHKFPRLVRDLAQKTGKNIDLVMQGEDTELDRSVIEEINDPLIHLLRNAVDHGIETPAERAAAGKPERGRVQLTARHEQGRIVLTVEDDGRGMDPDRLRKLAVSKGLISDEEARALPDDKALELIFLSGFTSAKSLSDISGRGVGMDIVRNNIQRVNGTILIDSTFGKGTIFQIILPLTLAIIPALLVKVCSITFAVPIVMVAETLRLTPADIQTIRARPVTRLRNKVLPLVHLGEVFNLTHNIQRSAYTYAVVVNFGKQQIGLMVDMLMGEEEVVVKSIGSFMGDIPGISSATILGDGSIALIVDIAGLLKISENR